MNCKARLYTHIVYEIFFSGDFLIRIKVKSQLHTSNFVYNILTVLFFFRGFFSTTLDLIHRSSFLLWSLRHTYINNTQGYHREQSGQDVPVNILTQLKF